MATFKAEVYSHQKKQDGTYNIKIRVTHNQKKKYLATTYYATKNDLTRNLKLKNQFYIDETDKLIKKYREICNRAGEGLKAMTIDQVVSLIKGNLNNNTFDLDIVEYGREWVKQLRDTGHAGNAKNYENSIKNLVKFVGREKISVREITVKFLNNYIQWIQEQPAPSKKVKGGRAKSLYLSNLRAIHNRAKNEFNDEDSGIIRIPLSPFKKVKIPKVPPARKRALELEHLKKLANLDYTIIYQSGNNRFNLAKDVFLLSFGLIGMNAVDLYYCNSLKKGRITYQRQKTKNRRDDKAEISIKIEPEFRPLVEKYKDPTGVRVFNFYHHYSSMDSFCAAINKGLKLIGKEIGVDDLEFYAARHTWATIATNEAGVDKFTVHSALNHVDEKMRITDFYIKKSWSPIDQANRKVLDYVKLDIGDVKEPIYTKDINKAMITPP